MCKAVIGQQAAIDDILIALIANGHILVEGVPGLGKTLLVRSLLEKLYVTYPSTRQLASRLQTSHTAIAHRLRKYGIPGKS